MKTFCRVSLIGAAALGSAALVGCDDTVSKSEETKMNADGSTMKQSETVKKDDDGGMTVEKSMEKTPATQPAP